MCFFSKNVMCLSFLYKILVHLCEYCKYPKLLWSSNCESSLPPLDSTELAMLEELTKGLSEQANKSWLSLYENVADCSFIRQNTRFFSSF